MSGRTRAVVAALAALVTLAAASSPVTATAPPRGAERPDRIVSLSASLTEWLYAIDAGDQVIAVDKYSNFPAGTPITELSGFQPNIEAVADLDPDLVVLSSDRDGIVDALATAGIPALLLEAPGDLDGLDDRVATLAEAVGRVDEGAAALAELHDGIDAAADAAPERDEPLRYYYELSDAAHTVTSSTFVGSLLAGLGMVSIADGIDESAGDYPQLSAEFVVDADPDVVLIAWASGESPSADEVAERPGWSELSAVAGDRIVVLDSDIAARWGPRVTELVAIVGVAVQEW